MPGITRTTMKLDNAKAALFGARRLQVECPLPHLGKVALAGADGLAEIGQGELFAPHDIGGPLVLNSHHAVGVRRHPPDIGDLKRTHVEPEFERVG